MKKFLLMAAAALTVVSLTCSCGKDKSDSDKDKDSTETTKTDESVAAQLTSTLEKATADMKANPENAKAIISETDKKLEELTKDVSDKEQEELMNNPKVAAALEQYMYTGMELSSQVEPEPAEPAEMAEPEEMTPAF